MFSSSLYKNNRFLSKIKLYSNLFCSNREYKKLIMSIYKKNMDRETFKRNTIIKIEENSLLNLELSEKYKYLYLNNFNNKDTAHFNYGLKKLEFENNLYKEIIIDLFTNEANFRGFKKILSLGLFDNKYYKLEYNYNLSVPPLLHYLYHGYYEGKNPSSYFDADFYMKFNPNARKSGINPLVYLVLKGMDEGMIKLNPDFHQPKAINRVYFKNKLTEISQYGLNNNPRDKKIIVSLTSYPLRMNDAKYAIYSLLKQKFRPDKLILWLAEEEFPNLEKDIPIELLNLTRYGLEIRWYHNVYSYKKLIPVLKEFPEEIIVTADDDIYYPDDWLMKLYKTYLENQDNIIVHRARKMFFKDYTTFTDYNSWELITNSCEASYMTFMTGAGGILYPPHALYEEVFNEKNFLELCKYGDDIWFWAMAVLNYTKFKVVDDCYYDLIYINPARELNLINETTLWLINRKGSNDKHINDVIKKYPKILKIIHEDLEI